MITIRNANSQGKNEIYCTWFQCPSCDKSNIKVNYNYCPDCGEKLKWDLTDKEPLFIYL